MRLISNHFWIFLEIVRQAGIQVLAQFLGELSRNLGSSEFERSC